MNIEFNIPDFIPVSPHIKRDVLEAYIAGLYREGKISRGHVRKALGFSSYWQTMEFLSNKGAIEFTKEMVEQDLEYVKSHL